MNEQPTEPPRRFRSAAWTEPTAAPADVSLGTPVSLGIPAGPLTGLPARPWQAVVSSRLGRQPLARRLEIATIHRWTEQAVQRGDLPMVVPGTAAHPWVVRACQLIGVPPVELVLAGEESVTPTGPKAATPPIGSACPRSTTPHATTHYSIIPPDPTWGRDRIAFELADRIDVVHVRPGGTLHPLLLERLRKDSAPSVRVLVPVAPWGQTASPAERRLIDQLIAAGAIGYCWRVAGDDSPPSTNPPLAAPPVEESVAAIRRLRASPRGWLVHCTRGRGGPWPGQSASQFRDWLLLSVPRPVDLSPLATLQRIVGQRHLIGGGPTMRDDCRAICFSAAPLWEIIARRTFRPHVGRWDAEPYGIAIRRRVASRLGARPVVYFAGPNEPADVPTWRLQPCGKTYDWTVEREWRLPGDVDLRQLAAEDAILFVAKRNEVPHLAGSPWPVVSIESLLSPP